MAVALDRVLKYVLALVVFVSPSIGFDLQSALAAGDVLAPASVAVAPATPIEQALLELKSEDAAVRSKAVALLIEKGDASLIPKLDEIRADADRAVRQAIKPVIDLLKQYAQSNGCSSVRGAVRASMMRMMQQRFGAKPLYQTFEVDL